jgi:hypothetical protein
VQFFAQDVIEEKISPLHPQLVRAHTPVCCIMAALCQFIMQKIQATFSHTFKFVYAAVEENSQEPEKQIKMLSS